MTTSKPIDETIQGDEVCNWETNENFLKQIQQIKDKFETEKELFQREMFHRFKNNLQVITSLLNIQSSFIKDEDSLRMFVNCTERVKTIAMIYDKQYQTQDPATIYFDNYLKNLVNYIVNNYKKNTCIVGCEITAADVILPVKTSLSCGLIIYELVSNSLYHAFNSVKEGNIKVNFQHLDHKFILSVEDNGIGLPEDFNIDSNNSLGLLLVKSLTEQINGSLELKSINGTKFILSFPDN